MIDHDRALELAATALDFGLDDAERDELQSHLDACAACRATDEQIGETPTRSPIFRWSMHPKRFGRASSRPPRRPARSIRP